MACNNCVHAGNTGISKNYVATWDSVSIGGEQLKVAVVGLHFKAFPTDKKSCAQREGQAAVARATIEQLSASGVSAALQRVLLLLLDLMHMHHMDLSTRF